MIHEFHEPVRNFKKGKGDLGAPGLPSRQEAFLSGVTLSLCKQSPAMYAYLRDAEVDKGGKCWLVFFKLPPDVVKNLGQVINVEKKEAFEFQQHGVFFTAISLEPSDDEMKTLERYYHDKGDEAKSKVVGPDDDEQTDSAADRLATVKN